MNERKIKMLETALGLFAKKGYHGTSIQEITDAWGISKGAFYTNFSSKEELMLCIMKFYTEHAFKQIQSVTADESEKETFIQQIRVQFSIIDSHKEFLRIQLTEQPQQMTEELQRYVFETRSRMFKWFVKRLTDVYGQQIEPFVLDCVVLLMSMIHGYLSLIILDQKPLAFEKTARFLINRLDSIVSDFGDEAPLLTKKIMKDLLQEPEEIAVLKNSIYALRNGLTAASESVLSSLDALEAEFAGGEPREYMAEGLLLYLDKQSNNDEWKLSLRSLKQIVASYFRSL